MTLCHLCSLAHQSIPPVCWLRIRSPQRQYALTADTERTTLRNGITALQTSRPTSITQPILWVAIIALIAASFGSQLRITKCLGGCAPIAISCCTENAPIADEGCCSCCSDDETDPAQQARPESAAAGFPTDQDRSATSGSCPSDCCITIAFDTELAPIEMQDNLPNMFALAFLPTTQACLSMPARVVVRPRLFDRGPPRVDESTALRACTLLLI
jgi:hypothetical protein